MKVKKIQTTRKNMRLPKEFHTTTACLFLYTILYEERKDCEVKMLARAASSSHHAVLTNCTMGISCYFILLLNRNNYN